MDMKKSCLIVPNSFHMVIPFWDVICVVLHNRFLVNRLNIQFFFYSEKNGKTSICENILWSFPCGIIVSGNLELQSDSIVPARGVSLFLKEAHYSCSNPKAGVCYHKGLPEMISLYNDDVLVSILSSLQNPKIDEAMSVLWLITHHFCEKNLHTKKKEILNEIAQESNWVHRLIFPNNPYISDFAEELKSIMLTQKEIMFS